MDAIKHRGLYPKENLLEAIRLAKEKQMTSVEASEYYHVPQSTIRSHISNDLLRVDAGRPFYLSSKQEPYLVELIKSLDEIGIRLTKNV
ncbi:unnamed protein product [Rotaria sp. Silwood1]|nr:unnamed protein product [Rotaria sp. Silwood1]CAF5007635.1 unnamed protein product [Rotaria sp. Silwood1]